MNQFPGSRPVLTLTALALVLWPTTHYADAVVHFGSGASPLEIAPSMDLFRADLGGVNNGVGGGPFSTGFRSINWDGVGDEFGAPNLLPGDFFNSTSARGVVFSTPGTGFQVSAGTGNPDGAPLRFGNIDPIYASTFQAFSPERLFTTLGSTVLDISFFVPGMPSLAGLVNGFGAVFSDVDVLGSATMQFFDASNEELYSAVVPTSPNRGLSFLGVYFDGGEQVARVRITSGTAALGADVLDGGTHDLVVLDDFIYGEPQPVPEPAVGWLVLAGAGLFVAGRRWRRAR